MNTHDDLREPLIIDARFAGGHIEITTDDEYTGDGRELVRIDFPGHELLLFPHEARALAAALNEVAGR